MKFRTLFDIFTKVIGAVVVCIIVVSVYNQSKQAQEISTPARAERGNFPRSISDTAPSLNDPVSVVKIDSLNPGNLWSLSITAKTDRVTIKNVVVNRGCKAQQPPQLPQTLKFGQTSLYGYYFCDPIEVQVTTDQGNSTFILGALTQAPVSVVRELLSPDYWRLTFTSHVDNLTIKNVIVNRGNCKTQQSSGRLPQVIQFGQKYMATVYCNPIEVQVTSDQGVSTFKLD